MFNLFNKLRPLQIASLLTFICTKISVLFAIITTLAVLADKSLKSNATIMIIFASSLLTVTICLCLLDIFLNRKSDNETKMIDDLLNNPKTRQLITERLANE